MTGFLRPALVLRLIAFAAMSLPLSGCFALAPIVASTAGFYSTAASHKAPWDHLVSMATGEDCSSVHYENNQPYCVDKNGKLAGLAGQKQCYATLGVVECYIGPDPYGSRPDPVQDPRIQ